jgi:hypothetical protein
MKADIYPAGYTVADLARRYRVSPERVRAWIRRGELKGLNTRDVRCSRPRFVVTLEALMEFEQRRHVSPPPQPKRRRKPRDVVDFYPDG